jgi:hypothetical protein
VVRRIRAIVLASDARIDECIKWQAPTFTYRGNLASFYPKSRQHASLMFHLGARIPGRDHADRARVMRLARRAGGREEGGGEAAVGSGVRAPPDGPGQRCGVP